MTTISIISPKTGAGKTTLTVHAAAAAHNAGQVALGMDLDPQARPRPATMVRHAKQQGAQSIVIDTPADRAARTVVEITDLGLIPGRASAFGLFAIQATAKKAANDIRNICPWTCREARAVAAPDPLQVKTKAAT